MPHRPKEAPFGGAMASRRCARADSLYANGILSSFPFVGALAAAMDKATQREGKKMGALPVGRKEGSRDPKMSSLAPSF